MTNRLQPLVALRALKRLINDPEDTRQVFQVLRALAGNAIERSAERFKLTRAGKRILSREKTLMQTLTDRESLRALPAGTFGREYLNYLETENLSAEGLQEASDVDNNDGPFADPDTQRYALRVRDQHDLWHVAVGYSRDVAGEACLLGFTYAQTGHKGIGLIALVGAFKISQTHGKGIFGAIWQGYRLGRKARWLPAQEWETLLQLPLEQVRELLNIGSPDRYYALTQDIDIPFANLSAQ